VSDGPALTLTHVLGDQKGTLRNLRIHSGQGVGGKVLEQGRPLWVLDYYSTKGITHHYDAAVRSEDLRSMVGVPVRLAGGVRGVLYAAMRRPMPTGDRWIKRAMTVAHRLEVDCMVAAEVDKRLKDLRNTDGRMVPAARDQCLRDVHAELSLLRDRAGQDLQPRLDVLLDRIGAVMGTSADGPGPAVRLTQRQIDVLLQIATGASNAEAAERLGLTPATVKSYLQDATRRLGARNRVEAVAIARRMGLLP
jgi:DNA-binding CsgD family transcriptional regulator